MRFIITIIAIYLFNCCAYGQAKRPTIMVVPSDVWCNMNGYTDEYDINGATQLIPDYKSALQQNPYIILAISKINTLMAERGFPLKNLESVLKSINLEDMEKHLIHSKNVNPIDYIRNTAKADIIMQLTWTVNTFGPKQSISYNLQGLDSYTEKQIAGVSGTGEQSFSADVPTLLEEAVSTNMDGFCRQLQMYFDDLLEHGREVVIDVRVFNNGSGLNLLSKYEGKELTELIDRWISDNTVNHMFNKASGSETFIRYEQVRIPLFESNGMPMDAEVFTRDLGRYLVTKHNIISKVIIRGLGSCVLVLGEK